MFAVTAVQPSPPLRYAIDAAAGLLVIQVTSIADGPALLAALREIKTDPLFRPSLDVCVDCNTLRVIPTSEEIKELARLCVACPRSESKNRWVLIATWRPIYEAARFFATAVSAPNVILRVFEAWSDARVWLATTRAAALQATPWIGPSRALNELIRRSAEGGR